MRYYYFLIFFISLVCILPLVKADTQQLQMTFNVPNSSNCQVQFTKTSPITYPDTFTVYHTCNRPATLYLNGTEIANNSLQSIGAGTWNFTVISEADYHDNYDEELFVVNKGTPSLTLTNNWGSWIFSPPVNVTVTGNETNSGDGDLTYELFLNNSLVSNPYTQNFDFGTYLFIYNTSGGANWTSNSISKLLIIQPSAGVSETCRYKKYGYYNEKLAWYKQENCV